MPLKITLVSKNNGVGLTADMQLLTQMLTRNGHEVTAADWRSTRIDQCDVVIFLELFSPHLIRYARRSIGIFNPEWFLVRWRGQVPQLDQVWAKSRSAIEAIGPMNSNTHYTGFLSRDRHDPDIPRRMRCLHVQGHSQDKNTGRVIEAWRRNRDLPLLTIVGQDDLDAPPWVRHLKDVSEARMDALMNEHTIHLCPSKVEGWGHYISEALSVGAHVITTDASPMSEHVRPAWGTLLAPSSTHPRGVTKAYDVTADQIAQAVRAAASLPAPDRERMSRMAQEHGRLRSADFEIRALKLLEEIA